MDLKKEHCSLDFMAGNNNIDPETLVVGAKFYSYSAFKEALEKYQKDTNTQFVTTQAEKIQPSDPLREQFQFVVLRLQCKQGTRYKKPEPTKEQRPCQRSFKVGCPVRLNLRLNRRPNPAPCLKITQLNLDHAGHEVSNQVFQLYPEQRRILIDEVDLAVLGSTTMKTSEQRKILEERHSKPIKRQSIYYLQQKMGVGRLMNQVIHRMMRAIRVAQFGGPEVLKLTTDVPVPKPGDNEVLIKVKVAGVNPVDTYIRSGTYSRVPALPYTPGDDSAGVVEAVGSAVRGFKVGDRVLTVRTTTGSYAEYTTADSQFTSHLADRLSFYQGACVGVPYYTAYKSLHIRAQAKPGETVLIHGASGAVGIAAVQLSKAHGLTVYGTAGTKEGLELVKAVGADAVFNHREDGYLEQIMKESGGEGVNVILEMLSNVNLQNDLTLLKYRGRVVVIGCRGNIDINPRLTMGKESSIMGVALMISTPEEWRQMHAAIEAAQHIGVVEPIAGKVYPLSESELAQHDVINKVGTLGNLVIEIDS